MASNYDALYQSAGVESPMGSKLRDGAGSRMEGEPKRMRRENTNVTSRLPWPTKLLDPIQRLPPEISTFIIRDTLPFSAAYSSSLLQLTTVSHIWRRFLLSTPSLWSEVYIDNGQPDFLATLAIFIQLSGRTALKVAIYDRRMYDWAGLSSILLPVSRRITSLIILEPLWGFSRHLDGSSGIVTTLSIFFQYLGHLPRLQELAYSEETQPKIAVFELPGIPSTIRLTGALSVPMPLSALSSATPGRFFDIDKYRSFGQALLVSPLFRSCSISLRWSFEPYEMTVHLRGEPLSALKHAGEYTQRNLFPEASSDPPNANSRISGATAALNVDPAADECGLEHFTHIIGTSICHLVVGVSLSEVGDLVDFLLLLTRLQELDIEILVSKAEAPAEIGASSVVVNHLRRLYVGVIDDPKSSLLSMTQSLLRKLFSVLTTMYPCVEALTFSGDIWPWFASSDMESMEKLKFLCLNLDDGLRGTPRDPKSYSITLPSLEELVVWRQPLVRCFRTPNLLSLRLEDISSNADLGDLDLPSLRKLTIHPGERGSYYLNPLDYSVLCELDLGVSEALNRVDVLSFSRLSLIRLDTRYFTNPEGNLLCTELLYYPEGCPMLQELHFKRCLEWDILFLMLERRNFGLKGIRRIHTITLPFIPSVIRQSLLLLLAGESAERPPLESISIEETREVLFDPNVPGCCCCLKNMVPGCTVHRVKRREKYGVDNREVCQWTPDELYPDYGHLRGTVTGDVGKWIGYRSYLVDAWKSSYTKFLQEFAREEWCGSGLW